MNPEVGFYSLVQYLPDPGRLEVANIGVLLFCPGQSYLRAKTSRDNARIEHIFGSAGHDWKRIDSFKQGIEERLLREQSKIQTEEDLRRFIESRANEIRITPPRFIRIRDCNRQLDELFDKLVRGPQTRKVIAHGEALSAPASSSPQRLLTYAFRTSGLEHKIVRNVEVELPFVKNRVSKFPVGYQNDRFHLIRPVKFDGGKSGDPADKAYPHAVQGRFLFEHSDPRLGALKLVVVGGFEGVDPKQTAAIRDLLAENKTMLYTTDELSKLIDDVRRNARPIK